MIHGMTLCLHRGSTPTRNPSANDAVLTIPIRGGLIHAILQTRSFIGRFLAGQLPSLDRLLLLRQQLHQRSQSQRGQGRALLQRAEKTSEALLDDDLAGTLQIGPHRLAGLGRQAAHARGSAHNP